MEELKFTRDFYKYVQQKLSSRTVNMLKFFELFFVNIVIGNVSVSNALKKGAITDTTRS